MTSSNKIGQSQPSVPTPAGACVTGNAVPSQNPRNVRTVGDMTGRLHVEWTVRELQGGHVGV